MSAPIGPGDEVIVMRAPACPGCGSTPPFQPGSKQVVSDILAAGDIVSLGPVLTTYRQDMLSLVGDQSRHGPWWPVAWFRKLGGEDMSTYMGDEVPEDAISETELTPELEDA
jgi:hypothetical protein